MGITTVLNLPVDGSQFPPGNFIVGLLLHKAWNQHAEISVRALIGHSKSSHGWKVSSFSGPSGVHLQVDGGQIVPGVSIVWLLLCAAAEGLQRPLKILLLQCAISQREPPLWVQRIHPQSQLPMLCCLCEREYGSTGWEPGSGFHFPPGGFSMQ